MVHSTSRAFSVKLCELDDSFTTVPVHDSQAVSASLETVSCLVIKADGEEVSRNQLKSLDYVQISGRVICIRPADSEKSLLLQFTSIEDSKAFLASLKHLKHSRPSAKSVFDERTEEASAAQYFQFYGYLSQQQNMMQDYVRTSTYQHAMLANLSDFHNKVVLDVGAGSGILSFFAVQAGAKKVYAVEASSMAQHCQSLVKHNNLKEKISVICGKIEDVSLPEQVDTIISEPMGYMLVNERMLETFLHAKKFLKPGGRMFPTRGDLHVAPFSDESLYLEQCSKANFWCQDQFHGVNLSCLREEALQEYLRQPIVDCFDINICLAKSIVHPIDFQTASEEDLFRIDIPLNFKLHQTALVHGLAFWFDCAFIGASETTWLSTAPTEPLTHWYQVRCLLSTPVLGKVGDNFTGRLLLIANTRQSYDVEIELTCNGLTSKNCHDLKNPLFRYTGQQVASTTGQHSTISPTEQYYNQWLMNTDAAAGNSAGDGAALMNGGYTGAAGGYFANQVGGANFNYGGHTTHMNYGVRSSIRQAGASGLHGHMDPQQQLFTLGAMGANYSGVPTASHEVTLEGLHGEASAVAAAGEMLNNGDGAGELMPAVHYHHPQQNQQLLQQQHSFNFSAAQYQQQQQYNQQQLLLTANACGNLRPLIPQQPATTASNESLGDNGTTTNGEVTMMPAQPCGPQGDKGGPSPPMGKTPRLVSEESDITRTMASLAGVSFATTTTDSGLNSAKTASSATAGPQLSCRSGMNGSKSSAVDSSGSAQDMAMDA